MQEEAAQEVTPRASFVSATSGAFERGVDSFNSADRSG